MSGVDRKAVIERLRAEPDEGRRRLLALGMLTERLGHDGIEPILVGGGALEFYTAGGYATKDMDLALPVADEVNAAFRELGFIKEGRYWYHEELDLLFEAPAPAGLPGENAARTRIQVDGFPVVIIGLEDLVMDRLRAWIHRKSEEDARWTRRLVYLYGDRLDWDYLNGRAEGIPEEGAALDELKAEVSANG